MCAKRRLHLQSPKNSGLFEVPLYELDAAAIWLLLQIWFDVPLRTFDLTAIIQVASVGNGASGDAVLVYVPAATEAAAEELRRLAAEQPVIAFAHAPAMLRDIVAVASVTIEAVPDRLLADFSRYALVA